MKYLSCAVLGRNRHYISSLAGFIREKKSVPLEAAAFTDPALLTAYAAGQSIDILLVCDDVPADEIPAAQTARQSFFLGDETSEVPAGYILLNRYQSAQQLLSQLLEACAGAQDPAGADRVLEAVAYAREDRGRAAGVSLIEAPAAAGLIGVYSPLGRCGKTSLALALGLQLAKDGPAFYLNLEEYSGFSAVVDEQGKTADLSDLLFYASGAGGDFTFRFSSMIRSIGDLDYVMPVFCAEDLRDADTDDYTGLIRRIADSSDYRHIILDIGSGIGHVFSLLQACDIVYMPVLDDPLSRAKLTQFRNNCLAVCGQDLIASLHEVSPPPVRDVLAYMAGAQRGSMGKLDQYARDLLSHEYNGRSGN